jgi:predicted Ser/Thr protein kinase
MIPADAELSSEDKQAIRLRTGRFPVIFHPAAAAAAAKQRDKDKQREVVVREEEILKKRKASTTSEQYKERCGENQSRTNSSASQQR